MGSSPGIALRHLDADLPGCSAHLPHQVPPFADAEVVEELRAALTSEPVARQLPSPLLQMVPEVQQRHEVRSLGPEPPVQRIGCLALVRGAFARILDRQRRGDGDHLTHGTLTVGLYDHAAQTRIYRQAYQLPTGSGQVSLSVRSPD